MQYESDPAEQKPPTFIEQARRAQIVEAAAETVAELGYARTSLSRIADHAGISKGVITYHFATKDEILRLVVTQFFDQGWQFMEERIVEQQSALGQIRAWISGEMEFYTGHRSQFLAMSDIVANHREQDGTPAFTDEFDEEITGLSEILGAGQQAGEFRAFDTRRFARIIVQTMSAVLTSWAMDPSIDLDQEAPVLLDFIEHAIRAESP